MVKVSNYGEPNQTDMKADWIGPSDPISNLRLLKFHIPAHENPRQKAYRLKRQDTQDWCNKFWTAHNRRFAAQKKEFLVEYRRKKENDQAPSASEIAEFYKQFLDRNQEAHMLFNREWYRRQIGLVWPALLMVIERIFMKTEGQKN